MSCSFLLFLCRCVVVLLNPKKNRQSHIITPRWAENVTQADTKMKKNALSDH